MVQVEKTDIIHSTSAAGEAVRSEDGRRGFLRRRRRRDADPARRVLTRRSVPVRIARVLYALLITAFVICVLVQIFFAGMGAFGADWDSHTTFVHVLEFLAVSLIPVALVARLSWGLTLLPFGLVFLIGVQYAFANSVVPAAALHPVNALVIFALSLGAARRAWTAVFGKG